MNINTATILNLLSPKLNSVVKEKLDSLSVDGKINMGAVSKDKSIQTILSGLLNDISTGANTKENVTSLLQNNKQNFSFQNLTEDIKTLIKNIQSNPLTSSKLESQLASLKSSLIDIKNIDEKMIKTNISNSGILLESKLAQQTIPLAKSLEQLIFLLKGQLDITTSSKITTTIPKDLKLEIKTAMENILKDIKNIKVETNPQNQSSSLNKISLDMKALQQIISKSGQATIQYETPKIDNIDSLKSQLKDQLGVLTGSINTNTLQSKITSLEANSALPKDIKLEVKNAIESLLRDFKNVKVEQNSQKALQSLLPLETKINILQQNLTNLEVKIPSLQTTNFPTLKSDIITTIKDLFVNLKEQITNKGFTDIKNIFTLIESKITPLVEQNITAKSIKNDLSNRLELFKSLTVDSASKQQIVLQNILNNSQVIQSKIDTLPQVLFENNLSKTANFINDLKMTSAVIEEFIRNSNEPAIKELKTIIDKINTQIDFYQLLSYSTNSTHTYLSFLQDGIEDADIRFNKDSEDSFSCQINLTLKEHGDLKILMILDKKKNININIGLEQEEFKSIVQENLQKLRVGINNIDLLIQSLNIFSINSKEEKSIKNSYGSSSDFSFGLDIKA